MVPQGGDQLNDAVYVGDVGRSVYLALKAEKPRRVDFQHRHRQSFDAERFFKCGGQDCFPITRSSSVRVRANWAEASRAIACSTFPRRRETSGYEPAYDVERGVRDYVATLDLLGR